MEDDDEWLTEYLEDVDNLMLKINEVLEGEQYAVIVEALLESIEQVTIIAEESQFTEGVVELLNESVNYLGSEGWKEKH